MTEENSKRVMLVFSNPIVGDVFALAMEECIQDCETVILSEVQRIQEHLAETFSGIITDYNLNGEELRALERMKAVVDMRIPIFILTKTEVVPEWAQSLNVSFLPKDVSATDLVEKVSSGIQAEKNLSKYCRVPIRSLLKTHTEYQFDVYVKLSETKFVKIAHAKEGLDRPRLEKFLTQGIEQLYVLRSDFLSILDHMVTVVFDLSNNENASLDQTVETTNAVFDAIHSAFEVEGFTPHTKKLVEATIQLAIKTIQKNPELSDLLQSLNKDKHPFLSWHSNALAFLSCKLATLLEWNSENTFFKLSMASLLHDITLHDDELAKYDTAADLKDARLTQEQLQQVYSHPLDASKLVGYFESLPGEVSFIIEQHHERQNGAGFPLGLTQKEISSISALFIICHEIVKEMYKKGDTFNFDEYISSLGAREEFSRGSFGQVFRSIVQKYRDVR